MIKINRLYEDSKNFDKFEVHGGVFNKDTELEFAKQFEWVPPVETIKVKGIRGHISESDIELKIMLSDHGSIAYIATDKMSKLSIASELWQFLKVRKKWWLAPILILLLLLGGLIILTQGSALAPFIYAIF